VEARNSSVAFRMYRRRERWRSGVDNQAFGSDAGHAIAVDSTSGATIHN
jgi:hypothetical protein